MSRSITVLLLICGFLLPRPALSYSVLSHEEVVDQAWLHFLVPILQNRFPGLNDAQIREAHAYAYGGSVIQDIGYYPFGDKEFSDLLHYVRSGDFVGTLIRDAATPDELAFALGALAHYYGDTIGHPVINVVTGEEYPALRSRFGRFVTYGDDATAHLRTEFGFDVVEVAHGNYSQDNYRDFIGFQVAQPLLERAFAETYGLKMDDVMKHEDLAVSTYRFAVSSVIPQMTKVALASYPGQVAHATPGAAKSKFIYRMRRTEYESVYGRSYKKPGIGAHILAFFFRLLPKAGPLRALQLKLPNSNEQAEYLQSVNSVEDAYRAALVPMRDSTGAAPPILPELDFDTGKPTAEGEYKLADRTYAWLVEQLADTPTPTAPEVLRSINSFYADPAAQDALKQKKRRWTKLQAALTKVRASATQTAAP